MAVLPGTAEFIADRCRLFVFTAETLQAGFFISYMHRTDIEQHDYGSENFYKERAAQTERSEG